MQCREPGRAGALALQQAHLVPQHEDLEVLIAGAWSRADGQVDEERHEVREHEPEHPPRPFAHHHSAARCAAPEAIIADVEERPCGIGEAAERKPSGSTESVPDEVFTPDKQRGEVIAELAA
jgi:hypothetical protein